MKAFYQIMKIIKKISIEIKSDYLCDFPINIQRSTLYTHNVHVVNKFSFSSFLDNIKIQYCYENYIKKIPLRTILFSGQFELVSTRVGN